MKIIIIVPDELAESTYGFIENELMNNSEFRGVEYTLSMEAD